MEKRKTISIFDSLRSMPSSVPRVSSRSSGSDDSCSPLDIDGFKKRLQTFCSAMWVAKPKELSALQCAAHGWSNVATDELQCHACSARLDGHALPPVWDLEKYNTAVDEIADRLVTSHKEACIWRDASCPDSFCHLSTSSSKAIRQEACSRISGLLQHQHSIPLVDEACVLNDKSISLDQCQLLLRRLELDVDITSASSLSAVLLAFTGWSAAEGKGCSEVIACQHCFRSCGSWNFRTLASSSSTADISTVQDRHAPTPAPPATVASAVVRAADNDGNTESTKTSHELPTTSSALEVASGHDSNAESTGTSHALPTTASAVELAGSVPGTSPERSGASSDVSHLDAGSGKEIPATGHAGNSDSRDKASEDLEPAAKRPSVPESSSLPLQVERPLFDPLEQHRLWCPWLERVKEKDKDGECPAWKAICMAMLVDVTVISHSTQQTEPSTKSSSPAKVVADIHSLLKNFKPVHPKS